MEAARSLKLKSDAAIIDAEAKGRILSSEGSGNNGHPTLIVMGTAMTSKGTRMNDVAESPFFQIMLPSFLRTAKREILDPTNWQFAVRSVALQSLRHLAHTRSVCVCVEP